MPADPTLINRLRSYSEGWERMTALAPEYWHGKAMAEAADEIESLQLRCKAMFEEIATLKVQLQDCRYNNGISWPMEIERLNRLEIALANQLERSIKRNGRMVAALKAAKPHLDGDVLKMVADAISGNDE